MDALSILQMRFDLTRSMARALLVLVENASVSGEMIEVRGIASNGKVLMHRLRNRLKGSEIVIHSRAGVGYWLETEERRRLADIIKTHLTVAAQEDLLVRETLTSLPTTPA